MPKIHLLPEEVIAKIAAGEVIERPAFAIKELLENALDAHATEVYISLENAGIHKLTVIDNGEGMSKEDLFLCYQPHATSKISRIDELSQVNTFGFRGEALASIAAISTLTIQSRTLGSIGGYAIQIEGGKKKESPIGMPYGTKVIVENIFQNIPARKRFLKSQAIEFRYILDVITSYAICNPDIAFTLIHNSKIIIQAPSQTREERMKDLLGDEIYSQLIYYKKEESYINIEGYLSRPQLQIRSDKRQLLFINNRLVKNKLISLAIREAYAGLLGIDSYPVSILFITLPYEIVDVNTHPRKETVSFINESDIFITSKQLLQEVLSENNITFQNVSWQKDPAKGLTRSHAGKLLKEKILPTNINFVSDCIQLQSTYIITQTNEGIILIDQHAASERIFYEKYTQAFINEKNNMQLYELQRPIAYNLSLTDSQIMIEYREQFAKLGFGIDHFKKNTFLLRFVPSVLKDRNFLEILLEQVDNLASDKGLLTIDKNTEKMITFLACRSAIKAGDFLTKEKQKLLLKQLEVTPNNTICAHGRPTKIEFTAKQLAHMFGRRQ